MSFFGGHVRLAHMMLLLLCVLPQRALAQTVPGSADPGRIEQRFDAPATPRAQSRQLRGLETTIPPRQAAVIPLVLRDVRIEGSTVFTDKDLRPLYEELLGTRITLLQAFEIARRVTALYGKEDYVLSRAIIPPQELNEGGAVLRIQVIEGYIDEVIWPAAINRYRDYFSYFSEQITSQRPITSAQMDRYLLLSNDLAGLTFRSTLRASETNPGASTMFIDVEVDRLNLSTSVDNRGSEASGPWQVTTRTELLNWLGGHEQLLLSYTAGGPGDDDDFFDDELHYFSFKYSQVISAEGLTFSISGNASRGEPGTQILRLLEYETEGVNISPVFSYPFIRTRPENLTGTIGFDFKNSELTRFDGLVSKDRLRIIRGGLTYDKADEHNGINLVEVAAHLGIDGLGSTSNDNPFASRENGKVDFFRATIEASRTQRLDKGFSAYVSVFGQWSDDALLSSQECGYGGARFGRGYDASQITGDKCVNLLGELRYDFPAYEVRKTALSYLQVYGFADYGKIWNVDAPLGTPLTDDGSSAGGGLRFGTSWFNADFQISRTMDEPESSVDIDELRSYFSITTDLEKLIGERG